MTGHALVTGGGSGIGLAVAQGLARSGVTVHLCGRGEDKLERAAAQIRADGGEARTHPADLSDDQAVTALCTGLADLRRLEVLVHSAATVTLGRVLEQPVMDFDRHYRINLRAPYLLTQRLLPLLLNANGQVVFINSGAGLSAKGGWSQYAASKHGLKALADSLREEVKGRVRVLSIYPGRTASAMQREVRAMEGERYDPDAFIQPEDVAAQILAVLTLPRSAEVTDLTIRPGR